MNNHTQKIILLSILSLSLVTLACGVSNVLNPAPELVTSPRFCNDNLYLTSYSVSCSSGEPPVSNTIQGFITNLGDDEVMEASINMTIISGETTISCPIQISNLPPQEVHPFLCTFIDQGCLSDLKIDESSMTSIETCRMDDEQAIIAQMTPAETGEAIGTSVETGTESIDEAVETESVDILPNEGILTGSLDQQYENKCRATQDIEVDLSKRSYTYSLSGGCDWDDFTVKDEAYGGGVVYGDGWFEGQLNFVSTRTCKPDKVCQEDWLKGEQSTRSLVGYIDIPAYLISICEYLPDAGAGAGWDLTTFKQFAQDRGEFICPTDVDTFDFILTP